MFLIGLSSCLKSSRLPGGFEGEIQVQKDKNSGSVSVTKGQKTVAVYKNADLIKDSEFFAAVKTETNEHIFFIKKTGEIVQMPSSEKSFRLTKHFAMVRRNEKDIKVYNSHGRQVFSIGSSDLYSYQISDVFFGYITKKESSFLARIYYYNKETSIAECKSESENRCDIQLSNNFAFLSDTYSHQALLFGNDGGILFDSGSYDVVDNFPYYVKLNNTFAAISSRDKYAYYHFNKGEIILECNSSEMTSDSVGALSIKKSSSEEERKCLKDLIALNKYPKAVLLGDKSQYQGFLCSKEKVSCVEKVSDDFIAIHEVSNKSDIVERDLALIDNSGDLRLYIENYSGGSPHRLKIEGKFSYYIDDFGAYLFHSDIPEVLFSCQGNRCASFSIEPGLLSVTLKEEKGESRVIYFGNNGQRIEGSNLAK